MVSGVAGLVVAGRGTRRWVAGNKKEGGDIVDTG